MNILVVSSLTEIATANYLVRALRERGHRLLVYSDIQSHLADLVGPGIVDVAVLAEKEDFDPDLFLFVEGGTMRLFPIGLERLRCRTAWYGIDTHMDYGKHLRIARLFDITFVAQKQYVSNLQSDGIRQAFWLPLAFAPELQAAGEMEKKYKVAFVGSTNPSVHAERHKLLEAIRREIKPVYIGVASPLEMGKIYSQARIVFNKSINNDINMRYFEAMGAGAVLLTDQIRDNGVDELFRPGEHFLQYEGEESLLRKIDSMLRDAAQCTRIGQAARANIFAHHTYGHRAKTLIDVVKNTQKLTSPTPDGYVAVFAALGIPCGVLTMTADVLASISGGRMRRILNRMMALGIRSLGSVVARLDRRGI